MKILYVIDARSPIAQNWIRHFVQRGDEVYIASTFALPAGVDFPIKRLEIIPVAFTNTRAALPPGLSACVPLSDSGSAP